MALKNEYSNRQLEEIRHAINELRSPWANSRNGRPNGLSAQDVQEARNIIDAFSDFYHPDEKDLDGNFLEPDHKPEGRFTQAEANFLFNDVQSFIGRSISSRNQNQDAAFLPTELDRYRIQIAPYRLESDTVLQAAQRAPTAEPAEEIPGLTRGAVRSPSAQTDTPAQPQPASSEPAEPTSSAATGQPAVATAAPQEPASETPITAESDGAAPSAAQPSVSANYSSTRPVVMGSGNQIMPYDAGIREAQLKLTALGFDTGPVDGKEGPWTRGGRFKPSGFNAYANEFDPPLNLREMTMGDFLRHIDEHAPEMEAKYGPRRSLEPVAAAPSPDLQPAAGAAPVTEAAPAVEANLAVETIPSQPDATVEEDDYSMDEALLSQANPNADGQPINLLPQMYQVEPTQDQTIIASADVPVGNTIVPQDERGQFIVAENTNGRLSLQTREGQAFSGEGGLFEDAVVRTETQPVPTLQPAIDIGINEAAKPQGFNIA